MMGILDWLMGEDEPLRRAAGTYTKPYDIPPRQAAGTFTAPYDPPLRVAAGTPTAGYNPPIPRPRPEMQGPPMPPGGMPAAATQGAQPARQGLFGADGRDKLKRLAIALEGMTMNPNEALIGMLQGDLEDRKKTDETNRTVAWLKTLGTERANVAAAALEAGSIDAGNAVSYALTPGEDNVKVVGKRLVRINADGTTTDITPGGEATGSSVIDSDQLGELNTLRDDLRTQTADFNIVKSGFDNVSAFYSNPGAVSDYALAVGFAKIVDPGSVAREGEVAAVAGSGAITDSMKQSLINAINGKGALPENVRYEIAMLSREIYMNRARETEATIRRYQDLASRAGLPADMVYMGSPIQYPPAVSRPGNNPPPPPTLETFKPAQ